MEQLDQLKSRIAKLNTIASHYGVTLDENQSRVIES
jgi:hypothetical protein